MTTKVVVRHFHEGNDADRAVREKATYATRARLITVETGEVLGEAWAYCSPRDQASRKRGRTIAVGRLEAHAEI